MEKYRRKVYLDRTEESQSLLTSNNDDYMQMGNLHPKKREDHSPASRSPRDQTIECDIQPSDTLLSLTLKYNIPLAELKRVNNILQESEFYALKRIKIPVKPASFLKDLIPGVHSEDSRRENGWFVDTKDTPNSFSSNMSSAISTGYSSPCSETEPSDRVFHESKDKKKVRKFLKEFDRDLERIKEKQLIQQEMVEDLQSVPELDTSREEIIFTNIPDSSQHSGISNGSLLCWCFLVVLLVLALLVILMALISVDHHSISWILPEERVNSTKSKNS
ncbi:lysM and putative peptidoglycan-binding domain-containing protein 3 [Eurytemora carolleeae]|uniref:lysM and putative peptidoglycan-binding domain-containing protein 3 n=1 Tax=Eurytemora carolleeae TaxID=1294199 RepID=UPI000C7717AF|nr:lysM and putative peptidoglycan-binding domain-containing protein 3 [Eurytemora carolleeae]|eukprot:XP_023339393.1 lysM and putative peptidoglycan-binding domain-containing protein 3-like [Eurytemora affinis]